MSTNEIGFHGSLYGELGLLKVEGQPKVLPGLHLRMPEHVTNR